MRSTLLPVSVLILTGCASIPVGLKIAALAGTGVSYAATGKSLSDHALSAVAGRDCNVIRAVDGGGLCRPPQGLAELKDRPATAASQPVAAVTAAAGSDGAPDVVLEHLPGQYLVIGSFTRRENAERWASFNAEFGTDVYPATRDDRQVYRVLVGPLDEDATALMREILTAVGIGDSWRMAICGESASPGACPDLDEANLTRVAKI